MIYLIDLSETFIGHLFYDVKASDVSARIFDKSDRVLDGDHVCYKKQLINA